MVVDGGRVQALGPRDVVLKSMMKNAGEIQRTLDLVGVACPPTESRYSAKMPATAGLTALALLVFGLGYWSTATEISGAIIADGVVAVENNRQVVQHPEGGLVGPILARDGDRVNAGSILLRLDDTLLLSELSMIDAEVLETGARGTRLTAESLGLSDLNFPAARLRLAKENANSADQLEGQRNLFHARIATTQRQIGQIDEQILQIENEIGGTQEQLTAFQTQQALIAAELEGQEKLLGKGLVQFSQVSALKREAARLAGQIGQLVAMPARLRGQIAGLEIERLKIGTQRREDAISQLRDIQLRQLELVAQKDRISERLSRLDVRAPVSGVVYGSTVFAERSAIRHAENLLFIIPNDAPLVITSRFLSVHIDQVPRDKR
jgi:HlyD family secretion protein